MTDECIVIPDSFKVPDDCISFEISFWVKDGEISDFKYKEISND